MTITEGYDPSQEDMLCLDFLRGGLPLNLAIPVGYVTFSCTTPGGSFAYSHSSGMSLLDMVLICVIDNWKLISERLTILNSFKSGHKNLNKQL